MGVLSLDLSTKRSGWAYRETLDSELQYGIIASAAADVEKRIGIMRDGVRDLLEKYKVDKIIIEEVRQDGNNNHTAKVLTWLQGVITVMAYEYDKKISVELIGASTWRSNLGIQGHQVKREKQKIIDIDYVNTKYNLSLNSEQDDEADAIGILDAYFKFGTAATKKERLGAIGSSESAF